MTSAEYTLWLNEFAIAPWDELRADLRAATVAATIANIYRDKKRRAEPFKASDFMPYAQDVKRESAPQDIKTITAFFEGM